MRKFIKVLLAVSILFTSTGWAWDSSWMGRYLKFNRRSANIQQFPDGLTWYKDYSKSVNLDPIALYADYALGSTAATYTNTRTSSTPGTYLDASGVNQVTTTSNLPRITQGYYAAGGAFVSAPGYLCEPSSTNYLLDSNFGRAIAADNWDTSYGTITDSTSLLFNISGAKRRRIDYTYFGTEGNYSNFLGQTTANDSFDASGGTIYGTVSFWARGDLSGVTSGTGNHLWVVVYQQQNDNAYVSDTHRHFSEAVTDGLSATDFHKFTIQFTCSNANTRKIRLKFLELSNTNKPAAGENAWIEIEGVQVEKNQFGTSHIPTTTSVLTRNADVLTGLIANNRTAATETCIVKFIPLGGDFSSTADRHLLGTITKTRLMSNSPSSSGKLKFAPNGTDNGGSIGLSTTSLLKNTSYVITGVAVGATGNPNTLLYLNGVLEDTDNNDWTVPAWGTTFSIGSTSGGNSPLGGIIQKVAFFNRALSADEILKVKNQMNE